VDATNINDGDTEPPGLAIKEEDSSSSTSNDVTHDEELSANPPTTRPLWAHQKIHATSGLVGDPSDTKRTCSQFQGAPHVFIATTVYLQTFHEASSILKWDETM
jgi:hypothetical protein